MLLHMYVSIRSDRDVFETNLQVIPEAAEKNHLSSERIIIIIVIIIIIKSVEASEPVPRFYSGSKIPSL